MTNLIYNAPPRCKLGGFLLRFDAGLFGGYHRPIVLPIITANNKTKKNGSQSAIGFGSAARCRDVGEGRCSVIVTGKRSARNVDTNSVGECEAKPAETVQEIKAEFAGNGVKIALRLANNSTPTWKFR